jgi:hypothetical protein
VLKDKPRSKSNLTLREQANKRLADGPQRGSLPHDLLKLIHELEVHQIELEMQNEELRRSQFETETAKGAFIDFYDFAPVGYLTLTNEGIISELNLTTAILLGTERTYLVKRHLHRFIK